MIFIHASEIINCDNGKTDVSDVWLNLAEVKCLTKKGADCYAAMSLAEDDPTLYRIDKVCNDTDVLFAELFNQTDSDRINEFANTHTV